MAGVCDGSQASYAADSDGADGDGSAAAAAAAPTALWRPEATALTFVRTKLHALYLSTVFARSPALPLPAQRLALLAVSFSRGVEQLLRCKMATGEGFRRTPGLHAHAENMVCCMLTLRTLLRRGGSTSSTGSTSGTSGGNLDGSEGGGSSLVPWAAELAEALLHSPRPQDYLTEAPTPLVPSGVASVCQVRKQNNEQDQVTRAPGVGVHTFY